MGMTNPPNPIQFWAHITAATTPEIPVPIPFPIQVPIPVGPLDPGWKTASATCSCLVLIYSGGWFIYRRLLWAPCCVIWGRRWVARDSQLTTLDLETTQKHPAAPQRKTFLEPPRCRFLIWQIYTHHAVAEVGCYFSAIGLLCPEQWEVPTGKSLYILEVTEI